MKVNKELVVGTLGFLAVAGSFILPIIPPEISVYFSVLIALIAYKIFDLYHKEDKEAQKLEELDQRLDIIKTEEAHKLKELDERLDIIRTIMQDNGHNQITTFKYVTEVEKESDEIIVITEDLLTDIESNGEYDGKNESIGLFAKDVHENIKKGIQYTYYIKNDMKTNRTIKNHFSSHYQKIKKENPELSIKEPKFILIPSDKFCFFSEIYLYKKNNEQQKDQAFEWLPAVSDQRTRVMYYVNLDTHQTSALNDILVNLHKEYYKSSEIEVDKIKESLNN